MENDVEKFLKTISEIESSSGKNTDHKTMQSGIHAGEAAMGSYGLMPNTVRELVNRAKMTGDDSLSPLLDMDGQQLKSYLAQNPEVEKTLASSLAKRVLTKFQDPEQAAYAWNQGHNLTPEKLSKRNYQDSDYVKKYRELASDVPVDPNAPKLASKVGVPLPSFANETGEINDAPNVIGEQWDKYQAFLDETTQVPDNLKPIFGDKQMMDMSGIVTPGPQIVGKMAQFAPAIAEEVTAATKGIAKANYLPNSVKELISKAKGNGFQIPVAEEAKLLREKDPLTKAYKEMNRRSSSVMDGILGKRPETQIDALPINHSYADAPIADIESKQRALDLLKKKY